jgi:hypothetical protein
MVKKKLNKKTKILFVMATIVLLAIAVIGLYFITPKAVTSITPSPISLTKTPDYNICNLVQRNDIESAMFSEKIVTLGQPVRSGIQAPNGTIADSCGFRVATEESNENTLYIYAYPYLAIENGENKEAIDASWSQVAGSNPVAYFGTELKDNNVLYKLRVLPGGKNVVYELRQPKGELSFNEDDALNFLVSIAAKATYSVLEPVISE